MTELTEQHINELRQRMEQYRTTIRVGTEALRPLRRLLGAEEVTDKAILGMPVVVSESLPPTVLVVVSSTDVVYFDLATGKGWRYEQQAEMWGRE